MGREPRLGPRTGNLWIDCLVYQGRSPLSRPLRTTATEGIVRPAGLPTGRAKIVVTGEVAGVASKGKKRLVVVPDRTLRTRVRLRSDD
jgi:hypothetical protein